MPPVPRQSAFEFGAPDVPEPASIVVVEPEEFVSPPAGRVVRVRPDVPAIDKLFDYEVPDRIDADIRIGTAVRVALHGRRVGGWIVADDVEPPPGVKLQPLAKVSGWGPPAELIDLADWAAWRWAGRPASFLRTATAATVVRALPPVVSRTTPPPAAVATDEIHSLASDALNAGLATLRLPPAADPYPVLVAAAQRGPILVVGPVASTVRRLGLQLRRAGFPVALMPDDWAAARSGGYSVMGSRAAAWAPVAAPAAIVVLDEHDESLQQEQAPTWNARDVLIERARRGGVPCILVSPAPSLEALAVSKLFVPSRTAERAGWPRIEIVDRRDSPPGEGLYSVPLVDALRSGGHVICILNRKGHSRLSSCAACGEVATCERCAAAVVQADDGTLVCLRCDAVRPTICVSCGATKMKNLRAGVSRVREELEALAREPVTELTADTVRSAGGTGTRIVIGTEAALHQIDSADVVAFLDFDQELLAPRYRASEEAMAIMVRAARLVGNRAGGGRILVQTRLPQHEVLQGALLAEPTRVATAEAERRSALGYPPTTAMAVVSGASAPAWIAAFGTHDGVEVLGPSEDRWLIRAADHTTLCDALSTVSRPPGRMRLEVDPLRL